MHYKKVATEAVFFHCRIPYFVIYFQQAQKDVFWKTFWKASRGLPSFVAVSGTVVESDRKDWVCLRLAGQKSSSAAISAMLDFRVFVLIQRIMHEIQPKKITDIFSATVLEHRKFCYEIKSVLQLWVSSFKWDPILQNMSWIVCRRCILKSLKIFRKL